MEAPIDYTECGTCHSASKTIIHTLRDCMHSLDFWRELRANNFLPKFLSCQMEEWWNINTKCSRKGDGDFQWNLTFYCTIWFLWKWQTLRIFQNMTNVPMN